MGPKLRDELKSTPPKLTLSSLPSHKPLPLESIWAATPPLHPMVSIPFKWEEAPGRPKPTNTSSPTKPKFVRSLQLPPRLFIDEAILAHTPPSPITVLDGPIPNRSQSHRFFLEGLSPKNIPNISGNDRLDQEDRKGDEGKRDFGPWSRWASGNGTKWNKILSKGIFENSSCEEINVTYDMDIEVKITRFRKRSRGSLYKLSHASSRVVENILECLKQIVVWRRKHENSRTEAS